MNIMNTYNGYKNKDTWQAMLYINNNNIIYETIYNMINCNIIRDIIHTYICSQLNTDIKENDLSINIENVCYNDICSHIYLDVVSNNKLYN